MKDIKIETIVFDALLSNHENECLRGAVIHKLKNTKNPLVHNHLNQEGALRYDYPLVQYKNIGGYAAIVCLEEGIQVIEELIDSDESVFEIGSRRIGMRIQERRAKTFSPQIREKRFTYRAIRWQALNTANYQIYKKIEYMTDKILFLEKIMIGHILALYRGLGIQVDEPVICKFTDMERMRLDRYKDIQATIFNVTFATNISLPIHAGLGKGASIGFGTIFPVATSMNKAK